MDESGLKFTFLAEIELLYLDLLGEINPVLRHSLVDSFFCAPVDCELLILLFVVEIVNLVLRKSLLLHCREISVKRLDVDSDLFFVVDDYGHVVICVCNADVCCAILKIRLAVIVMVEIHFLFEHLVKECSYCKFLSSLTFTAEKRNLFHFISRNGNEIHQLVFRLSHMPHGDFGLVV